jgi:hypothetical protein
LIAIFAADATEQWTSRFAGFIRNARRKPSITTPWQTIS